MRASFGNTVTVHRSALMVAGSLSKRCTLRALRTSLPHQRRRFWGLPSSITDAIASFLGLSKGPRNVSEDSDPYHVIMGDSQLDQEQSPYFMYFPKDKRSSLIIDTATSIQDLLRLGQLERPISLPAKRWCTIREIEGKGLGLVAKWNIFAGELLMRERPVYLERRGVFRDLDKYLTDAFSGLSEESLDTWHRLCNAHSGKKGVHPSRGIEYTNGARVRIEDREYKGVFPTISRINHSCSPTANMLWDPTTCAAEVRASRLILQGEEILLSYINPVDPGDVRRANLTRTWGFICKCAACKDPASDRRRERIAQVLDILASCPQDLVGLGNVPLTRDELEETLEFTHLENLAKQRGILLQMGAHRLLKLGERRLAWKWRVLGMRTKTFRHGVDQPAPPSRGRAPDVAAPAATPNHGPHRVQAPSQPANKPIPPLRI